VDEVSLFRRFAGGVARVSIVTGGASRRVGCEVDVTLSTNRKWQRLSGQTTTEHRNIRGSESLVAETSLRSTLTAWMMDMGQDGQSDVHRNRHSTPYNQLRVNAHNRTRHPHSALNYHRYRPHKHETAPPMAQPYCLPVSSPFPSPPSTPPAFRGP